MTECEGECGGYGVRVDVNACECCHSPIVWYQPIVSALSGRMLCEESMHPTSSKKWTDTRAPYPIPSNWKDGIITNARPVGNLLPQS